MVVGQIHYELCVHDKAQQFGFVGFYCTRKYGDVALFVVRSGYLLKMLPIF